MPPKSLILFLRSMGRRGVFFGGISLSLFAALSCSAPDAKPLNEAVQTAQQVKTADRQVNAQPRGFTPPYVFPELEGWRSEAVALPLGFAPQMSVKGYQDLRFSPGMFTGGAPDYWSYGFVWWLDAGHVLKAGDFTSDLEDYFTGLADIVDRDGDKTAHQSKVTLETSILSTADLPRKIEITARVFDGFVANDQITLNMKAEIKPCSSLGKKAVIFTASPKDMNAPIWQDLRQMRAAFKCSGG